MATRICEQCKPIHRKLQCGTGGVCSHCGRYIEKRLKRKCLRCDRVFTARGRYNRICTTCSSGQQFIDGDYKEWE